MFVTYKLSSKTIGSLKKKGFSDSALENLLDLEDQVFSTPDSLLKRISTMAHSQEIMEKEKLVLKAAKGYFRLDRWIPNKTLREWVEALIFALVVAAIVRTYMFAPFQIPSGSMIPTIQIGDHIFASMYSYGSPIPFTNIKLFRKPILRGDIVIFPYPRDPSIDYIKRVIGLSGETLEIRDDQVYIDGVQLQESYACYNPPECDMKPTVINRPLYPVSNFGPVSIPEGKLFVMGDNRYNSADSRFWGFVDIQSVVGKAQMIYWSHDPRESYFSGYQLGRIFTFLE